MSRLERDRAAALEASKASQAQAKRENAAHTPGPWMVEPLGSDCFEVKCEFGYFIATCHDGARGDRNADVNARLIAAAPEMLDALDGLAAQVRPLWAELDIDGFRHSALKEAYDFACKVAGKAQGEPQ